VNSADLLRRGAALLSEACPRCGGVQIRFQGKVYCINEDDLSEILSTGPSGAPPRAAAASPELSRATAQPSSTAATISPQAVSPEQIQLRRLLEEKLQAASKQLEVSQDLGEQEKLLGLISKYIDTLEKLKRH